MAQAKCALTLGLCCKPRNMNTQRWVSVHHGQAPALTTGAAGILSAERICLGEVATKASRVKPAWVAG